MIPSLSDEINTVIRPYHTTLNQLILHLLPSALPPHASTPQVYARGIAHFLLIYSGFEVPLRSIHALALPHHRCTSIHRLYIPALERSPSLEYDINYLFQRPHLHSPESSSLHRNIREDVEPKPSLNLYDRPRLSEFVTHISTTVVSKPHVLLAYTWIFYMALFQGGRYIRSKLLGVEENGFWVRELNAKPAGELTEGFAPLSFWQFPAATRDGEDLKTEFKARFQEIESSLTPAQKKDVVEEAVEIMTQLLEVVREIDTKSREENLAQNENPLVPSMGLSNKKPSNINQITNKEEPAFLTKLLHLSMDGATEVLIRLRSFVSFAPSEPLTVSVPVNDNLKE